MTKTPEETLSYHIRTGLVLMNKASGLFRTERYGQALFACRLAGFAFDKAIQLRNTDDALRLHVQKIIKFDLEKHNNLRQQILQVSSIVDKTQDEKQAYLNSLTALLRLLHSYSQLAS